MTANLTIALLATSLLLLLAVAAIVALMRTIYQQGHELQRQADAIALRDQLIAEHEAHAAWREGRNAYLEGVISQWIASKPQARASVTVYRDVLERQEWRLN